MRLPYEHRRDLTLLECQIWTQQNPIAIENAIADHRISMHPQQKIPFPIRQQICRPYDLVRLRDDLLQGTRGNRS